jgi:hypothetical protein
LEEELDL